LLVGFGHLNKKGMDNLETVFSAQGHTDLDL